MDNLLENLNSEQLEAVKHGAGPLLIVAGAGTGKTTVITRRIAYLIEQGLAKPDQILALTFTEKAASEMQERADILLPLGYYDLWISTFHSFCERVLKNHALDIGLPNDFKLLDDVSQWILILKNFDAFKLDYYRPLGSPNRFISSLLKHFSRCKDELITPAGYLEYAQKLRLQTDSPEKARGKKLKAPLKEKDAGLSSNDQFSDESEISRIEEVAGAFHTYQKLMLDNNFLDFGDLINCTLELFQKRPKILEFYRQKFRFIMVDEFQDTNFAQYQLVKLLAGSSLRRYSEPEPGPNLAGAESQIIDPSAAKDLLKSGLRMTPDKNTALNGNLVVVGDDDQSIYKFRGASVSNILKFRQEYKNSKQITLSQNYRSTQPILDLAYNFIQNNNPDRLEVKLRIEKKLQSHSTQQGEIKVLEGGDLSQELNLVAKRIVELKLKEPKSSWNDFALLIRANSAADELLPVLSASGIPYTFVANKGLYKKPIVLDVLSYMRLIDDFYDAGALYKVLTLPKFSLSPYELSTILLHSKQKTIPLFEALTAAQTLPEISQDSRQKIKTLIELLHSHAAKAKTSTAAEIMVMLVKDLGIEQKLKEETAETAEARELLDQFYKQIEEFEKQDEHKHLHNFLEFLKLEMEAGSEGVIKFDPNSGPESLKVMTIHAAKGLEFNHVFIINMVEQRFPTREKSEAIEIPDALVKDILPEGDFHLQEERRLFYVAVTRARKNLYLSWAKNYGGTRVKKPSQFLLETSLVPSENSSKATGKVIFNKTSSTPYKNQVYTRLPTKFSYTDLNTFQACPLEYKYRCYLKLPMPGSYQLSFGNSIHKTFEDFLKLYKNNSLLVQTDLFGKKPSDSPLPEFKVLESLYAKNWLDDWYKNPSQKKEYRKLGSQMLKKFYDDLKTKNPKTKYIEQFFKLKIGSYDFVGKIDRADQTNGGLTIIDYKTGKTPKTKKDIDQLYIYQWAAQEFLHEKVEALKYWYLQDNTENQFVEEPAADEKEITRLKDEILEAMEKIVDAVKFDRFSELDKKMTHHDCEFSYLEA